MGTRQRRRRRPGTVTLADLVPDKRVDFADLLAAPPAKGRAQREREQQAKIGAELAALRGAAERFRETVKGAEARVKRHLRR